MGTVLGTVLGTVVGTVVWGTVVIFRGRQGTGPAGSCRYLGTFAMHLFTDMIFSILTSYIYTLVFQSGGGEARMAREFIEGWNLLQVLVNMRTQL